MQHLNIKEFKQNKTRINFMNKINRPYTSGPLSTREKVKAKYLEESSPYLQKLLTAKQKIAKNGQLQQQLKKNAQISSFKSVTRSISSSRNNKHLNCYNKIGSFFQQNLYKSESRHRLLSLIYKTDQQCSKNVSTSFKSIQNKCNIKDNWENQIIKRKERSKQLKKINLIEQKLLGQKLSGKNSIYCRQKVRQERIVIGDNGIFFNHNK